MLTSLQNPLVKQLRKLHKAKERHEQQLSLLEGTHLIEEAIATERDLATLCCTADWQTQHLALYERAINRCDRAEIVSPDVLAAIATTVNPDGVVATIDRLLPIEPPTNPSLGVLLDTVQDPGNLGTMIRTATAANADGLWLSGNSVDLDHPKVLRASAGQWFRLPMAESDDLPTLIEQQKQQGVQIVATLPNADRAYWDVDLRPATLLLLGNEGAGLSPELAAMANIQVSIPLARGVESLNVAIACALILYEAQRQRQA